MQIWNRQQHMFDFVDLSQLITLLLHSLHAIPNFILF